MNKLPILIGLMLLAGVFQAALATKIIADPATFMAIPLAIVGFVIVVWQAQRVGGTEEAKRFLTRWVIIALTARLIMGTALLAAGLALFFGGDFMTYHWVGTAVADHWLGGPQMSQSFLDRYLNLGSGKTHGSRAGYYYFVSFFYLLCGSSLYVMAVVMSILGALSCLLVYAIGRDMFSERVGRQASVIACLCPSIILWTCLGYKDGLIIFSLLLAYRCTQLLQIRISPLPAFGLALSLWSAYYVRGYIFYVAVGPIILALTSRNTGEKRAFYNQLFGLLLLAIGLFASGLGNNLLSQLQEVNLKEVSATRRGMTNEAASAIEKDADVSTPGKALAYLPTGLSYFILAPFPWQMTNLRQLITLPEMLIWWSLMPSVVRGLRIAVRDKLGQSSGIIIFLMALTLVYSLAQGNVGTAYRVRAQLLVFYFIFAAVGLKSSHWLSRFLPVAPDPEPLTLPTPPVPQRV